MDIIKQEYEDYWNVSEVEREICRGPIVESS